MINMKTLLRFFLAARFTALLAILTSGVYITSTVFAPISVAEAKKKKRKRRAPAVEHRRGTGHPRQEHLVDAPPGVRLDRSSLGVRGIPDKNTW